MPVLAAKKKLFKKQDDIHTNFPKQRYGSFVVPHPSNATNQRLVHKYWYLYI